MPEPAVVPVASHVGIDEYEREQAAAPTGPKASEFKLEGDDVPEEFRGKSAVEVAREAKAAMAALRISEDARVALRSAAERPASVAKPPAPVEEPELTREQLKTMYDEDPLQAIEAMNNQALRRAEKHLETRLSGMEAGTAGMAENWARQEYEAEFKLFGDDIQKLVDSIPNKSVFGTKKGWTDAVAFARGQQGNFEKLMDFRINGAGKTAAQAREEQESVVGHVGTRTARSRIPAADSQLDDIEREIAKEFIAAGTFKDEAEYAKWKGVGGAR